MKINLQSEIDTSIFKEQTIYAATELIEVVSVAFQQFPQTIRQIDVAGEQSIYVQWGKVSVAITDDTIVIMYFENEDIFVPKMDSFSTENEVDACVARLKEVMTLTCECKC